MQNGSLISANAFGGTGGNITIFAEGLFQSPESAITASLALGVNGTVTVSATDSDTQHGIAVAPGGYFDAAS